MIGAPCKQFKCRTVFVLYVSEPLAACAHEKVTEVASDVAGAFHATSCEACAVLLNIAFVHAVACVCVAAVPEGSRVPTEACSQALTVEGVTWEAQLRVYSPPFATDVTAPFVSLTVKAICMQPHGIRTGMKPVNDPVTVFSARQATKICWQGDILFTTVWGIESWKSGFGPQA